MIQSFLRYHNSPSLILFFAGWGMDEHPFLHLVSEKESDLMICYDYRFLGNFDADRLRSYREIRVVAWSMGVWAASQVLSSPDLPITESIAINGTLYPIDEQRGISPAIFQGTLDKLDEVTLVKFQRRMCLNATAFKRFRQVAPHRSAEELKEELAAIACQYESRQSVPTFNWQRAVIGYEDRIFSPINQYNAWEHRADSIETCSAAHYDESLFIHYLNEAEHNLNEPTYV